MTMEQASGPIGPLGIGLIPEWDLADRLTKSLRVSGIGVSEMAGYLEVTRETVGRWINGRGEPKTSALATWASITQVNLAWLANGNNPMEWIETDDRAERARRYSKPQPSDWEPRIVTLISGAGVEDRSRSPRTTSDPHATPASGHHLSLILGGAA